MDDTGAPDAYLDPLLVKPGEAAELLGISLASLRTLVRRDRLRCVEFVAAGFRRPIKRFRIADLREFCERSLR